MLDRLWLHPYTLKGFALALVYIYLFGVLPTWSFLQLLGYRRGFCTFLLVVWHTSLGLRAKLMLCFTAHGPRRHGSFAPFHGQ